MNSEETRSDGRSISTEEKNVKKAGIFRTTMRWYMNRSFLVKLLLAYVICGALPIMVVLLYFFFHTTGLLRQQAYNNMEQDRIVMENSLNLSFQSYRSIIERFKNDKNLNSLLSMDYENMSYTDLAYYADNTLDDSLAVYPEIHWIRFYSSNQTLPKDGFYFYSVDDLPEFLLNEVDASRNSIMASAYMMMQGDDELVFISRMNYYSSDSVRNYIAVGVSLDSLEAQFYQNQSEFAGYLFDRNGVIVCSSQEEKIGSLFYGTIPDWKQMEEAQIQKVSDNDGGTLLGTIQSLDMGMSFVLTVDESMLLASAREAPLHMLLFFILLSLLSLIPAILYSQNTNRYLQEILTAVGRIGRGEFDWEITSESNDELGQIAGAVNQMNRQIEGLIRENYQKQLEAKSSELNLLQEQINPHFLYNALTVISSMAMREGARETIFGIRYLADFYRISLNKGRQVIHIYEERSLLENYMKIQMIRFSDLLDIRYEFSDEISDLYTVKLLLQPLVENAIHHAREEEKFMHIIVRGFRCGDRVCMEVEDDGIGMDEETLDKLRQELQKQEEGFGLKNVDKRIKLQYGQEYGVSVDSTLGKGTRIHLEIPACTER